LLAGLYYNKTCSSSTLSCIEKELNILEAFGTALVLDNLADDCHKAFRKEED
jgi:hypothetical protein